MADSITFSSLKTRARERANMENSGFVSTTELASYINTSYAELYDLLVSRFEDYYTISTTSTVTSGNNTIAVPSDFYKLVGLDYQLNNSDYVTVTKFNFQDRNRHRRQNRRAWLDSSPRQYRLIKNNIYLLPEDGATGTYRIWYVPNITRLSDDADTVDAVNGWEEYIVVDAAMKMLAKEESDISALLMEKQALIQRVEAMAQNRDQDPEMITDTRPAAWLNNDLRWDF